MFDWGLNMGVEGASLATTVSQFVTFFILAWFYASGRSIIKIRVKAFRPSWALIRTIAVIGIPTAVIQICLSVASSLTNIAAASLPQSDEIIAAYGVVQRLILIGCYVIMGFMQGYQPVASYAFGAKNEDRFHESVRFALKGSLLLTVLVAAIYIILSRPLIMLFNRNPVIIGYGSRLLISQVALYPAFGLCYMMTITFQTIGASRYGLFLSVIRQGLFYIPFILTLPMLFGVAGIYFSQPAADNKLNMVDAAELKAYINRIVDDMDKAQLAAMEKAPLGYAAKIRSKIETLLEAHYRENFERWLETERIVCKPYFRLRPSIHPATYTDIYARSLYAAEDGDMNKLEQKLIVELTALPNVRWWHRNIARQDFAINGFIKHYPDILIMTQSGKLICAETKGEHLKNDDSREKIALGQAWRTAAGKDFRYYMVFENEENLLPGAVSMSQFIDTIKEL